MFLFLHNNRLPIFSIIFQQLCLFLTIHQTYSQQIFAAQIILSNPGTQFVPVVMSAQLISTALVDSIKRCSMLCMTNALCRVYDYEVSVPKQCRLFEGDTDTLGQIVSSPAPQSIVGTVNLSPDLFAEYGDSCSSFCYHSRYLQCGNNFTCECMPHTYWDASISICVAQTPVLGAPCQQNKSMCREDLNYTCLQFNQCGPLSVLSGTTFMNSSTKVAGNSTAGLNGACGIVAFGSDADSVIIADSGHHRVVGLWNVGTIYQNISVITTEWAPGQPFNILYDVYVDVGNGPNLYVSDYSNHQVVLYTNMQSVNPPIRIVAGTGHVSGSGLQYMNRPSGIQVDSHGNVIVASYLDHRIMFWPPNATNGTILAGVGIISSSSMGLHTPSGMVLDESNSWLYVADRDNHRIQRYSLNGIWPCNGTTVAGGNGPGSGSHQLFLPVAIKLSKKTGALYIADMGNNRIQRWPPGATEGVTIAGNPNGVAGTSAIRLNFPAGLALNANETYMYVSDTNNNRLQRFQLI